MTKESCMAAIATKFKGIEYRSRLEARWAAFMHKIGWDYTYEPFDGDGYIPDFLIHGNRPLFVEVKPAVLLADYQQPQDKVSYGLAQFDYDVLIVGVNPFPDIWRYDWYPPAGWMGERLHMDQSSPDFLSWDTGMWIVCTDCHSIAVIHSVMSYGGRPCWCASGGDGHLSNPPMSVMQSMWADACNEVKWRGRAK